MQVNDLVEEYVGRKIITHNVWLGIILLMLIPCGYGISYSYASCSQYSEVVETYKVCTEYSSCNHDCIRRDTKEKVVFECVKKDPRMEGVFWASIAGVIVVVISFIANVSIRV